MPAVALSRVGARARVRSRRRAPGCRYVAADGKTSRGARRADGTRVHLIGAADHGGHLLDHLRSVLSTMRPATSPSS